MVAFLQENVWIVPIVLFFALMVLVALAGTQKKALDAIQEPMDAREANRLAMCQRVTAHERISESGEENAWLPYADRR
jgi:hypothetical protein